MIYLDTHVVVWLFQRDDDRLRACLPLLEGRRIIISPMVLLELQLLHEIKRIAAGPDIVLQNLARTAGVSVCNRSFGDVVAAAVQIDWTRDPFDRLIVAQAIAAGAPLCTADDWIRRHFAGAVWGASPHVA